jgi:meso-butanediol dehydrogenase / (S,S)-butanediol dehydrogenase / diacetyl reductase
MTRKTAFVTGAARGLGKEVARALGRDGHALYLADVLGERLEETAGELRALGYDVATRTLDVSSREQCFEAVADCVATRGDLSVLVNCAGIVRFDHFTDVTEDSWNRILAVNLSGPFFLTQAALPHLIAAHGNVVNVASSNGLMGTPYTGPYSATKAALINLTKTLAMEYVEQPIRVNAVCPGPMATEIGVGLAMPRDMDHAKVVRYSGQRGLAEASDVANVVAFLASDAAASVHGAVWTADVGTSAG